MALNTILIKKCTTRSLKHFVLNNIETVGSHKVITRYMIYDYITRTID